jgi:hypothetical protein
MEQDDSSRQTTEDARAREGKCLAAEEDKPMNASVMKLQRTLQSQMTMDADPSQP